MRYAVLDCETTIQNKGSPYTPENKLCLVGIKTNDAYQTWTIEYDDSPYGEALVQIHSLLENAELIVGANLKFDLAWIRRYIHDLRVPRVWDIQLAEFILGNQLNTYPSLDQMAISREFGCKLNVVKSEYWALGIDTPQVPLELLEDYLKLDCELTEKVFLAQQEELVGRKRMLFNLQCEDLKILHEMEWNGLLYNFELAKEKSAEMQRRVSALTEQLYLLVGRSDFSIDSSDQLSCVLYGGSFPVKVRETYERTLKSGEVVVRERWGTSRKEFPRIARPLPRTECKPTDKLDEAALSAANADRQRSGLQPYVRHFSVGEPVIKRLRGSKNLKRIVEVLLERAECKKLDNTYYTGLADLAAEQGWRDGYLHGTLNQCSVVTGRLSSARPNLQNFSGQIKELFFSRFV